MGFSSVSNLRLFIPQFHWWLFLQNHSCSAPPITDIKQPDTALQSTNFSQNVPPFWIIGWFFFSPLLQDHWSFLLNYLICYSDHWVSYSFPMVNIFPLGTCSFVVSTSIRRFSIFSLIMTVISFKSLSVCTFLRLVYDSTICHQHVCFYWMLFLLITNHIFLLLHVLGIF